MPTPLALRRALSLVLVTLGGLLAPRSSIAQGKPVTIMSFDGMTTDFVRQQYDESGNVSSTDTYYTLRYTVKNTNAYSLYVVARVACQCGSGWVYSQQGSPDWVTPGQTLRIALELVVPSYQQGTISVWLIAEGKYAASYPSLPPADSLPVPLTILNGVATAPPTITDYRPAITPRALGETVPFGATISRAFAVNNVGTRTATYTISASCVAASGCTPSKTTTTIAPGATDSISVSLSTSTTPAVTGSVRLIAAYTDAANHTIADTGSRFISTPPVRPVVDPKTQPITGVNGQQWAMFQVTGAARPDVSLVPLCKSWATTCSLWVADPDPEDPSSFWVEVFYTAPSTPGSPTTLLATVGLIAQVMNGGQVLFADTALKSVALGYTKPVLTPKTASEADPPGSLRSFSPIYRNTGNIQATYATTVTCTGVTNCVVPSDYTYRTLPPGLTAQPLVKFTAPPIGQTGTVRVIVTTYGLASLAQADTTTLTVTGADLAAPTFPSFVGPSENSTVSTPAISVSFIACDADGVLASPTATLNDAVMTASVSSTTYSGCASAKTGTLTGVATPGANTINVSLSDGVHVTNRLVHFTYDEAAEAQPQVAVLKSSELLQGGRQWSDTFSVRNAGSFSVPYSLSAACSGTSSCVVSQPTVTVAAGQTVKAWVTYTTATTGMQGTVALTAAYAGAVRTVIASSSVSLQLDQAAPTAAITGLTPNATISVLPSVAVAWCDADGTLVTHTVTLDGAPLADTYAAVVRSGCITAGTSSWASLPVALGAHTIEATATDVVGHTATTTVPFTFLLPALTDFQPRVTAQSSPTYLILGEQTWAFAVRNAGTQSAVYQLAPVCASIVATGSCRVDKTSTTLSAGQTDTVRVTFSVTDLPASLPTFKVVASYQDLASRVIADTGIKVGQIPTLAQLYQPQIPADPSTHVQPPNSYVAFLVPVTNLGIAPVTYHMSYVFTGGFSTRTWLMADTLRVGVGQMAYYLVEPLAPTTNGTHGTAYVTASFSTSTSTVSASVTLDLLTASAATPLSVGVSPRAIRRVVAANVAALDTFTVTNTGSTATKYSYAVACAGAALACAPTADSTPLLQPQQTFALPVRYVGGATAGTLGTVSLHVQASANASVFDDGVITDSIVAIAPLSVVTRGVTGGATMAREQCLTIAAGDAAAYECGDLRLMHALPSTTTMNTMRAPTLVYNNRHQSGIIIVPADVRVVGATVGATVTATVKIKNQVADSVRFDWPASQADGLPRRVAVPVNVRAKGLGTGVYEYTFQVRATIGAATYSSVATDTLVVINRATTQFGPGWWLDGLEQLFVVDAAHRLWVGGDGSTRVYTQRSDTTWLVIPNLDRVDSLTTNASHTTWVRHLRNGATVDFNAAGQHAATTNSRGHRTRFVYNTSNAALLDSIVLPVPAGAASRAYTFTRSGASGYVTQIDAPSTPNQLRRTSIGNSQPHGQWVVSSITDPDLTTVSFGYDASDRIVTRTNRRGIPTAYAYDEGQGFRQSSLVVGEDNIVRTFCPAETASLSACASGTIRTDSVRTWVDGPRRDVGDTTWFRLTAYGAPSVITDALHQVTVVERGDTLWPLLPTKVIQPSGHEVRTSYDVSRGLTRVVTDVAPYGGGNAVTTYDWDAKWDAVTLAVMPQGGGSSRSSYDPATGLKQWEEDGRGSTTRVTFSYNGARQVQTVTTPGNAPAEVNRIDYDGLGNTWRLTSPSGIVTESWKDAIGRDTLTKTPTDPSQTESLKLLQRVVYNAAGSDSVSLQWNGADSLLITNRYDAEGNVQEVSQRGTPDAGGVGTVTRRFVYDEADRKISERLVHGAANVEEEVLHFTYDAAGNLITGGRDAIGATLSYDVLNRLTSRSGANLATYTYDALGMRTANNSAAQISRSYFPNGALKTDTLRIAKADWSTDFGFHQYGLTYTYDLAGHKIAVNHPGQLASGTTARTTYGYDPVSGLLTSVTDKLGQSFTYHYDDAGRLDQQVWRAGNAPLTETRSYDADSRLARRTLRMADNTVVHDDNLSYDSRDKVVKVLRALEVGAVADTFTFDVRGRTTKSVLGSTAETIQLDAFGNALQSDTKQARPGSTWSSYEHGSGRLLYRMTLGDLATVDTTVYDTDWLGNQYHTLKFSAHGPVTSSNGTPYTYLTLRTETQDTYDDRSKLISHTLLFDTLFQTTTAYNVSSADVGPSQYVGTELYRYDALGRRIWTRSIKGTNCNSSKGSPQKWTGCHNTLTRTVWDGNQVLYEIRTDGGPNASPLTLEDDGPSGVDYGVVGYVHGYGIDEPLAVEKTSWMTVIPFADWRGHFDGGLCGTAICTSAQIKFPQRNLFGAANSVANVPAPSWYGSLIEGQEDASGYLYRRNRYFDPSAGRFTQEDPIGLAGGNNLYGFGGGDAVNFSDPFGLCPIVLALAGPGGLAIGSTMCAAELAALATAAVLHNARNEDWPYTPRPKFRKGTSDDVEAALTPGLPDNTYVCPTCGNTLSVRGPDGRRGYDKDHDPKWAERLLNLKEVDADRAKVIDEYQKDVKGRCPSCNRKDNKPPEQPKDPNPGSEDV